jgi:hypothetical protein
MILDLLPSSDNKSKIIAVVLSVQAVQRRVSSYIRFARLLSRCRTEQRTRPSRPIRVDQPIGVCRYPIARYLDAVGVSGEE